MHIKHNFIYTYTPILEKIYVIIIKAEIGFSFWFLKCNNILVFATKLGR